MNEKETPEAQGDTVKNPEVVESAGAPVSDSPNEPPLFSLIINVSKDGQIKFGIDAASDNLVPDSMKIVGLLETVKHDLLAGKTNEQPVEMVDVVLEPEDFELPQAAHLLQMGKKPGDTVQMPKPLAFARESIIASLKAKKAGTTPQPAKNDNEEVTGPVYANMKVIKDEETGEKKDVTVITDIEKGETVPVDGVMGQGQFDPNQEQGEA